MAEKVTMTPEDDRPKARPAPEHPSRGRDEGPHVAGPGEADAFAFEAADDEPIEDAPPVTAGEVRRVLKMIGGVAHRAAGDARFPEHWNFEPDELDALEVPVTNMVNRSARLRAAVHRSDAATVALVLFGWSMRNAELGKAIERAEAEMQGEPAGETIEPAPGGSVIDLGPLGVVDPSEVRT